MHNKYFPITVFMCLFVSSLLAGHHSFREAQRVISDDLSQALFQTFSQHKNSFVCRDTIRAYKQLQASADGQVTLSITDDKFKHYLKHDELKKSAYVSFGLFSKSDLPIKEWTPSSWHFSESRIQSDTLLIDDEQLGETVMLKGISEPALAAVFRISDQRLSLTLASASLLWALFSYSLYRKKRDVEIEEGSLKVELHHVESCGEQSMTLENDIEVVSSMYGGVCFSEINDVFYDSDGDAIHFTPMQQQLMRMFWEAPSYTLSKEVICDELWPKKEDANDTLYTLIRRLKPVLEEHTELMLVADRGRSYSLVVKKRAVENS